MPSAGALQKTGGHLERYPGGSLRQGRRRYGLPFQTWWNPQDSKQTRQLYPQGRICVPWSLAPGGEEWGAGRGMGG